MLPLVVELANRSVTMAKILLIDDNPDILKSLAYALKANDYDVATAANGKLGLQALKDRQYDLVLTDLKMPEVGGLEVLDYLMRNSPQTLCIILTGYGTIENSVAAIKMGAFDYITKPVKTSGLLVAVEKALKFKLRLFAGVCWWREISDAEKTITCGKLEGGRVEYGIVKELGLPDEKPDELVSVKISKSTLEALKKDGIKVE